ncbi:hypothetical protein quinque_012334 [Culex quinquefasciatus]
MNIANKPVKSSKAVRVAGFDFPLTCEEDVDRLELMVNRNPFIKSQYIKYLTIHKPRNVDVGQIFNRFFDDEAMANFTWTGSDSTTAAKKAMKDYAIFTGCMLEELVPFRGNVHFAQLSRKRRLMFVRGFRFDKMARHGKRVSWRLPFTIASVTSVKVRNLTTMLDQQQHPAPPHIQHHLGVGPALDTSNHHHHDMFLGQLQQHHLVPAEPDCYGQPGPAPLPDDHHSSAVLGFVFPLATEDEIERLEISVKQSGIIRGQYVQYLNVTKPIHLSVVQSFSMFFSDYSMTNYSYYGVERAEYPKTPKKAMKKYEVFSSCMLEAWRSHGINGVILMEQLKKAIYHITKQMLAVERIKSQLAVYKRAAADGMVNPENVRRIKALRTQLAVLDHTRAQLQRPSTNYASVRGFDFPLASGDEVERLEQSVRQDRQVRAEFVRYLATKNSTHVDLVDCFGLFFADSSMVNYNWNGISSHRFPKRAMKTYSIFTDCFQDAWPGLELTTDVLAFKLKRTVEKINNRRNVQHSKRRRKARMIQLVEIE